MEYKETAQSGNSYIHMWDVATTRVFDGGFLFDKSSVPADTEKLPRGAFLKADLDEQKAAMIKTATLQTELLVTDTVVKVEKGALLVATDVLGIGDKAVTVGAIDTSNDDYDSFAITADALGALAVGAILQTYDSEGSSGKVAINPDGFNIAEVTLDAEPSCTVMYEVKGIVTDKLPQVVTSAIKTALKFCQFLS